MRTALLALLALAACGQAEPPPPLLESAQTYAQPWFICDGVDAPQVFVFERDGAQVHVAEYDKPNGAIVARRDYTSGEPEGATGSIHTQLTQDGAPAGVINRVNSGMLETPATAYTPLYSSVRFDQRVTTCRWLPRTRLLGFTGRRTIVIHEDRDGDLIYTTYDFGDAARAQAIDLSENGRSTTFSAEARGGEEMLRPDGGGEFRFAAGEFTYLVTVGADGAANVQVMRGETEVQSEPFTAYVLGAAES